MDLNLVVLAGRLSAPPEIRQFANGSRLARYLLTVRSDLPRSRVDVLPVVMWDPPDALVDAEPEAGRRVWAAGSVQRRFWGGPAERHSRLELVAEQVCLRPSDVSVPG